MPSLMPSLCARNYKTPLEVLKITFFFLWIDSPFQKLHEAMAQLVSPLSVSLWSAQ